MFPPHRGTVQMASLLDQKAPPSTHHCCCSGFKPGRKLSLKDFGSVARAAIGISRSSVAYFPRQRTQFLTCQQCHQAAHEGNLLILRS